MPWQYNILEYPTHSTTLPKLNISHAEQNRRLFSNTRSCDLSEEKLASTLADLEELNDPTQLVSYISEVTFVISYTKSVTLKKVNQVY